MYYSQNDNKKATEISGHFSERREKRQRNGQKSRKGKNIKRSIQKGQNLNPEVSRKNRKKLSKEII
jgi:hypothetical protein